jgi:hypothetical protein
MSKNFLKFFIAAVLFATPVTVFAQEQIENFNAGISVNPDASLVVSEVINYDFSNNQRHGVYRDIPVKYKTNFGNFSIRLSDFSVTNESGEAYQFGVSNVGSNKRIQIGDPDSFVTGVKTYVVGYKVERAINYFSDHDELYWNITGNDWSVPIGSVKADVILPDGVKTSDVRVECFAGPSGSQTNCTQATVSGNRAEFTQTALGPNNGLTIVVGWPKGVVLEPTKWQNFVAGLRDNFVLFLPVAVFLIMFLLWNRYGREPKGRGVIVAQYEAPDNLTPSEAGTLADFRVDNRDISAEIINLAVLGFIKIVYVPKSGFFSKDDYKLERLKSADSRLNDAQKKLMDAFFRSDALFAITMSQLKNDFWLELRKIKKSIYSNLILHGYLSSDPTNIRGGYTAAGAALIFVSFWLGAVGLSFTLALIVSGVIVLSFGYIMPAKTVKGTETTELILGLKEYLSVAEKDRIKFFNAPEKTPERFEKLLPYAMVLGVENEWAKQFEGIYNRQPDWYADPTHAAFNSVIFANSLHNFSATTNSAMTAHSSAAGGGSGFGGGGFSGGGFGGGGGGSW